MRQRGTVKWFSTGKGYGFITPQLGGKDIFVHYTGIPKNASAKVELVNGQAVEFEVEQTKKGPQAVNVNVLS